MSGIRVDISGALRKLDRLGRHLEPETVLRTIGERQLNWVDQNFKAEGLEKPWAPLKPSTIARRRSGSSATLQDSGKLKQSFQNPALGQIFEVGNEEVRIGTSVEYADMHESGTDKVPQRKILPSPKTAAELARSVVQAIINKARREASR